MPEYDPAHHYWLRESGRVYGSAADKETAADDPDYRAWLEAGGQPTPYPKDAGGAESFDEMMLVLKPYGLGRVNRLRAELEALDAASIRPLRALADGSASPEDRTRLAELETRAAQLRSELGQQS